jgi:hypothetical protein
MCETVMIKTLRQKKMCDNTKIIEKLLKLGHLESKIFIKERCNFNNKDHVHLKCNTCNDEVCVKN